MYRTQDPKLVFKGFFMSEKFLVIPTVLASTRDQTRPNESADFSFPTAADEADGALVFQWD